MKPFLYRWFPIVLWATIIFIASANSDPYNVLPDWWSELCHSSGADVPICNELLGRFSHMGEYAVLAALIARAMIWKGKIIFSTTLIVIGLSELYALSDEIHQIFVPGRQFQLLDLGLDLLGGLIGLMLFALIRKNFHIKLTMNKLACPPKTDPH